MSKNVSLAADDVCEVEAMSMEERSGANSLECFWMLSGQELRCAWTLRRRDAGAQNEKTEAGSLASLRVA